MSEKKKKLEKKSPHRRDQLTLLFHFFRSFTSGKVNILKAEQCLSTYFQTADTRIKSEDSSIYVMNTMLFLVNVKVFLDFHMNMQ